MLPRQKVRAFVGGFGFVEFLSEAAGRQSSQGIAIGAGGLGFDSRVGHSFATAATFLCCPAAEIDPSALSTPRRNTARIMKI